MTEEQKNYLWDLGVKSIFELESDQGILASSRKELYGCIFGRDSLITSLKLLRVYKKIKLQPLLELVRKVLLNLVLLQGKQVNIESGEQPGKCIHEFRPVAHEHLTKRPFKPWYVYSDQVMRNYDSVDATPLFLIALYRFWQITKDDMFLNQIRDSVSAALDWMMHYGDSNGDGLIDYQISEARQSGGLVTQNWMDSVESVFYESGGDPVYPLAPVEVQAYTYMAYRLWADFFDKLDNNFTKVLIERADTLRRIFNDKYPTKDHDEQFSLAFKVDGLGHPFRSVRSNIGHVLWASLNAEDDGRIDCILDHRNISLVVKRLMQPDMFEPKAGIRTLSTYSNRFSYNSYHNGSIWPHDNSLIAEGFQIHGFFEEARKVYEAVIAGILHFQTPIELYVYQSEKFSDYLSDTGQKSCKVQAWSAGAVLDAVAFL